MTLFCSEHLIVFAVIFFLAVLFLIVPFPRKCLKTAKQAGLESCSSKISDVKEFDTTEKNRYDINVTTISKEAIFPCVDIPPPSVEVENAKNIGPTGEDQSAGCYNEELLVETIKEQPCANFDSDQTRHQQFKTG